MLSQKMAIRFLKLQWIPWCFHLINTRVSCLQLQPDQPIRTIKLIKSDGLVKIYHTPINVSDLLLEFPKHLVCRSDSFYIGQKVPPLSDDDELQLGHNYFLLPNHFFQTVLSFVTIASFASVKQRNALVKKTANCQPFDLQKTDSGCLRIRVSDEFISQLMEQGRVEEGGEDESVKRGRVCSTDRLHKDYTQLVGLRQWKPSLDTIKEKEKKKRIIGSSFGIRRKNKSVLKGGHKSMSSSSKPNAKSKTR